MNIIYYIRMTTITVTDHLEVTIRICCSLIVTYTLTLSTSFQNIIPQSQVVTIGTLTSAFTMIFPTLLFSIGAGIFPGFVTSVCVALIVSTILLAVAATGGTDAYIFAYFIVSLVLSGLRFTKAGSTSPILLMMIR